MDKKEKKTVLEESNTREIMIEGGERKKNTLAILMDNIMKDDFKGTRRAGYITILLPCTINLYFLFMSRGRYLKNMLSIGSLTGGYFYLNFRLRNEIDMYVKKDELSKNMLREEINRMHAINYSAPEYVDETQEIAGKNQFFLKFF